LRKDCAWTCFASSVSGAARFDRVVVARSTTLCFPGPPPLGPFLKAASASLRSISSKGYTPPQPASVFQRAGHRARISVILFPADTSRLAGYGESEPRVASHPCTWGNIFCDERNAGGRQSVVLLRSGSEAIGVVLPAIRRGDSSTQRCPDEDPHRMPDAIRDCPQKPQSLFLLSRTRC